MIAVSGDGTRIRWQKRHTVMLLCFMAAFICYMDRVSISIAVVAMQEQYGYSETTKGLILSSFFLGYCLFQIPSGYLANRFGGRLTLGLAVLIWSVFTIITPFAAMTSIPVLIAARIGMGLGEAALMPGVFNLYSRWIPQNERSRAVSFVLSGVPTGTVFALLSAGLIVAAWNWPALFYVFGGFGIIWVVIWFARIHPTPAQHPTISEAERTLLADVGQKPVNVPDSIPWRALAFKPPLIAIFINTFCCNWTMFVLLAWLPSYLVKSQDFGIVGAGFYSALPWLIMFVVINLAANLADRMIAGGKSVTFVRKLMQTVGMLGSALFLILAAGGWLLGPVLSMCGAIGMLAFTFAGYAPNTLDVAPRYADVLAGITNTIGTLPGVFGVAITGWLVQQTGTFGSAFAIAAGLNIVAAIVWLLFATGKKVVD
jgi:Sugar phosphate permease